MNKTENYDFTIVVPVYNEEDNMAAVGKRLGEYLPVALRKTCVLFVNDCSTDNSLAMIKELCAANKDFFYISFERNQGLSGALKAGIDYTYSPLVGYIDSDLQTAPEDFNMLLPDADSYALVTGIRANRKDSGFKKFQSKFANGFRRMMTHDGATDTGCPLKVMQTAYARRIPFFTGMHRFLPALIKLQNGEFKQIPVRHFPRVAGKSKYHLWNRLAGPFKDCFAYRWMKKRYINYNVNDGSISRPEL